MSWLTVPTGKLEGALDLASSDSMLRVLATIKDQVEKIKNKSAVELLDLLLSDPSQYKNTIGMVAAKIGNKSNKSIDGVMTEWTNLKSKYESDQIQRLILLSRTFDQLKADTLGLEKTIDWKLLDQDINKTRTPNSVVTLNLHAASKVALQFEALATPPVLPHDVTSTQGSKALVRMGFEGALSVSGKAGLAAGPLLLDVTGSTSGEIDADLFFLESGDTSFGIALADNLRTLVDCNGVCSPFQAAELVRLIKEEGLYCMRLNAQGTLAFGASVSLGHTFAIADKIKASIGASVGYRLTKTGSFDYLFAGHEVDGKQAIAIQITRAQKGENVVSESLGLELDPRQLTKNLAPIIETHLGNAQKAVNEFRELLPGSDFVTKNLSNVIDIEFSTDSTLAPMIRSLVGLDSEKTPEETLRDLIIGKIETSADAWSTNIQSAVGSITENILIALPTNVINLPQLRDKLADSVEKALIEKRQLLLDHVSKKVTTTNEYRTLAKMLNEAGAGISSTVNNVQKGIDRIRSAVEEILNKIQKRINEMSGYLEAATTKTVSLRIASEHTDKQQDTLNIRFDLFPDHAGAQDVLSAILVGDMNQVITFLNSQGNDPAAIARSGSFAIYQSVNLKNTTDLVIWDIQLGSKSILDADVKWVVGIDGTITAMSQAKYDRQNYSLKEKRTVNFVESADLLFAEKKRTLSVGLTISNEDEEMSAKEVTAFFNGIVARKLLPQLAVDKAIKLFNEAGDKRVKKGRLDIGLTLTNAQLNRMFKNVESMRTTKNQCVDNDEECRRPQVKCIGTPPKLGCTWVLKTVASIQAEVLEKHHSDQVMVGRLHKIVDVFRIPGGLAGAIEQMSEERTNEIYSMYSEYEKELPYTFQPHFEDDLWVFKYRRHGAMAMYEILAHMKALAETNINVASAISTDIEGWTPDSLQTQQYRIAQLMPYWWYWSHEWKNWTFLSDEMRATNIALLESWVELAKGPDGEGEPPVVWASISLPGSNGRLVPTLLT